MRSQVEIVKLSRRACLSPMVVKGVVMALLPYPLKMLLSGLGALIEDLRDDMMVVVVRVKIERSQDSTQLDCPAFRWENAEIDILQWMKNEDSIAVVRMRCGTQAHVRRYCP